MSFCSTRATSTSGGGICGAAAELGPEQPDNARIIPEASNPAVHIRIGLLKLRLIISPYSRESPLSVLATASGHVGRVRIGRKIRRRVVQGESLCRGSNYSA